MGRWEPDAPGRLAKAALDLYSERGYEQTTVAEIANRAGLTERTYFRHYADKREVLFAGSAALQEVFVTAVAGAPAGTEPLAAMAAGLEAAAGLFADRRDFARKRQAVVTANADLLERELIKLAALASALAATFRDRGVPEPAATVTAEAGTAVFKVAFERWVAPDEPRGLPELMRGTLDTLTDVAAGAPRP
jgi:AcrR family transcriptional regulator